MKVELGEPIFVADQDGIRRDHDVRAGHFVPAGSPSGAVEDKNSKVRSEPGDLARPVADERRGRNDQGRTIQPSRRELDANVSDGLERLAQPHFVGQDAAFASLAQPLEERDAFRLVRAERGLQVARRLRGLQGGSLRTRAFGQPRRVGPRDGYPPERGVQFGERAAAHLRKRATGMMPPLVELRDDAQERAQSIDWDRHMVRVVHP